MSVHCIYSEVMLLYMSLYMCVLLISSEGINQKPLRQRRSLTRFYFFILSSFVFWNCLYLLDGGNFLVRGMDVCHTEHMYSYLRCQVPSKPPHRIKCPQFWHLLLIGGVRFYWASLTIAKEGTVDFEVTSIQSKLGLNWLFQIGTFQTPNRWRLDFVCAQTFSLSGDELASQHMSSLFSLWVTLCLLLQGQQASQQPQGPTPWCWRPLLRNRPGQLSHWRHGHGKTASPTTFIILMSPYMCLFTDVGCPFSFSLF